MPTPPPARDYYETLGVARTATADEIKVSYRRLARETHPDRNPGDPEAVVRFKAVSEAYQVLSDADRRAHYDRFGSVASGVSGVDFVDPSELFESLLGDLLSGIGGLRRGRKAGGNDVKVEVSVTLAEAARGVEKTVEFTRTTSCGRCDARGAEPGTAVDPCGACNGRGEVRYQQGVFRLARPCGRCEGRGTVPRVPCSACAGAGLVRKQERIAVSIPAGVEDDATRTVRGMGDAARGSTASGDLEIHIRIAEHPLFTRTGADLHCTVPISFPQAALGGLVDVPTIDGRARLKIPAGTQPGHQLRLRGKGMPRVGATATGDQIVTVQLEVPEHLSDEQRALVERLASAMSEEVHPQRRTFLAKLRGLFD